MGSQEEVGREKAEFHVARFACAIELGRKLVTLDETRLVAEAKRGDTRAFELLCKQAAPKIFPTLSRITKNHQDAEDALQDSLLRAFVHLRSFDGRSSFSTWLTRVAINSALMILRKKRTSVEISMGDASDHGGNQPSWEVPDSAPNPEDNCILRERRSRLREAVRDLRPAIRQVVEIQQLQEASMRETAQILGISVAAAKGRLFQARIALRKGFRYRTMGQARVRRAA